MSTAAEVLAQFTSVQNLLRLLTVLRLTDFLWPHLAHIEDGDCYDFIIVGGGTAGCEVASRLAELNASVLLVEAGEYPPAETFFPGLFAYHKDTKHDWNFTSIPNSTVFKYHEGDKLRIQQGKLLGGSQQVNYLLYGNGNPKDFDHWAKITDDPSWSWKQVREIFLNNEKVTDKNILHSAKQYHGTKGKISLTKYTNKAINKPYFDSYRELGYRVSDDLNENNTFGYTNAFFSIGRGIRQTTAYKLLSAKAKRGNLHIMLGATATKIIFDKHKRAIGINIFTDKGKFITVKAKKEIIITAGAIKSPQLLMASGIGPKDHLKSMNITVLCDLPVGQNLHDNPNVIMIYKMGKSCDIKPPNPLEYPVYVMDGRVALHKSHSTADYQILSGAITHPYFFQVVCTSVFGFIESICDEYYKSIIGRQVHFITHYLLYSKSRGEVRLNCSDVRVDPIINPCYYCENEDLENHARYLKHYNRIVNTTFYKSVDAELLEPSFCGEKKRGSSDWWKTFALGNVNTLQQFGGTCALGSVVDPQLRVKGVEGLRVGDASVMPTPVGSTVQATVMMIAQKLVDMLIKEHNLVKDKH